MKKSAASKASKKTINKDSVAPAVDGEQKDFLVVGIGASAGGIKALQEFFGNVPADSGVAYVVILHLSPDHESRLAEVLQAISKIPVRQVNEKVLVEPNRVYVVPPNLSLSMLDGHIGVQPVRTIEERRAPVDIFFRTLGESVHERAVAVVLSGTGADGSMGIKRVKERGGVAFVQNPREAEYSDMPRNSIATDLIDQILNVGEIPARIIDYKNNRGKIQIPIEAKDSAEADRQALQDIFTQLRVRTKHDFSNYKQATILRRIERRRNVRNVDTLAAYADLMREKPEETQSLLKDLLISVTNFFRDEEAFNVLERDVIPRILQSKIAKEPVRVWIAGCATGEEAYSIAMLFAEQREKSGIDAQQQIQIFATDIDESAIAVAREGFYTLTDAADVSAERLRRFFTKQTNGFRVRPEIREMVLFANHNIIKDPPFSRLDLATCRNLLIYLNETAQRRVMETFHFALNPGGFMFIGSSESLDGSGHLYASVSKENHIFQSRSTGTKRQFLSAEVPTLDSLKKFGLPKVSLEQEISLLERRSYGELHQQLLEQFAPPSIVVNEEYDIIHLSERAGRYLQMPGGEPSHNLLKVVRRELRLELRAALHQSVQRRVNVETDAIKVRIEDQIESINIHVRPVLRGEEAARGFLLVLFEPSSEQSEQSQPAYSSDEPVARRLEEELIHARTQLKTSIEKFERQAEELKAANEELQAMNEELRSSGEEMETGKEELQLVNEELVTVNQELKIKIEELASSNNNFQNLINSIDIGTIFLDRSLRVNLFSPAARSIFNLIPSDFGRPLSDITHRLEDADFTQDVESVLEKLQPIEREVSTTDGRTFLLRVQPYRTAEDRINGVVLTFPDISERKRREEKIRETARELAQQARIFNMTLTSISDLTYIFDRDGRFLYANKPLLDLLDIDPKSIVGKNFFDLNYPKDLAARLQNQIQHVFDTKETVRDETPYTGAAGEPGFYEYIFTPVLAADGTIELVAGSTRDVTTRKQIENELRLNRERLQKALEIETVGVVFFNDDGAFTDANAAFLRLSGWSRPEMTAEKLFWYDLTPPEWRARSEQALAELKSTGRTTPYEKEYFRKDGTKFWGLFAASRVSENELVEYVIDIGESKRSEEALRASEEHYSAIINQNLAGIMEIDLTGKIVFVNRQFCEMVGYTCEELTRMNLADFVYEVDLPESARLLERMREEGAAFEVEKRFVRKDGLHIWVHNSVSAISGANGQPESAAVISFDITERRLAEDALRESEERLKLIMESVEDYAIITIEIDGVINGWNTGAENLFGWTAAEAVGQPEEIIFTPEDRAKGAPKLELQIALQNGSAEDERWHIRRDGSRFFASGIMTYMKGGERTGFVKIARDQTERLRVEIALQEKETLRRLVGALEDERRRIARDIHDHFGQQLTALRMKLDAVKRNCKEREICNEIDQVQTIAQRLDADVDFIAWELRPSTLDDLGLRATLSNFVREWSLHTKINADFHASGIGKETLEAEIETNLYRIAQEALNNIYKHAAAETVSVLLERRGGSIKLIIEDDGKGFKVDDKKLSGRGLGLGGMRERAKLCGGTLEIESTRGQGTTVFARVPAGK